MTLVRLAKEEEGVGISAGAHLAGVKSAMLMQNHWLLASINGIVSCAQLYHIPLLMLVSLHVVFDNESLLSVGGFPTATATGSNLAGIAAAAGVPRTTTVTTLHAFRSAFEDALAAGDLTTIVAKVEAVGPSAYVTDLSLLENRFQFQRYLRS